MRAVPDLILSVHFCMILNHCLIKFCKTVYLILSFNGCHFQAKKSKDEQHLTHLRKLKEMGVDMTPYLLSQHPRPNKIVKVVSHGNSANLHLHQ